MMLESQNFGFDTQSVLSIRYRADLNKVGVASNTTRLCSVWNSSGKMKPNQRDSQVISTFLWWLNLRQCLNPPGSAVYNRTCSG